MKKLFEHSIARGPYVVEATVVRCTGTRYDLMFDMLCVELGISKLSIDDLRGVGGAVPLASSSPRRGTLLDDIMTTVEKHGSRRIILILHEDCAGYGGSAAFDGRGNEAATLERDLREACKFLIGRLPTGIKVEGYIQTATKGVFQLEDQAKAVAA